MVNTFKHTFEIELTWFRADFDFGVKVISNNYSVWSKDSVASDK